eukprot:Gb_31031 [translate_table: standard]
MLVSVGWLGGLQTWAGKWIIEGYNLTALQRTLEFEEELAERFGGGTATARSKDIESDTEELEDDVEHDNHSAASEIRKKYEKKLAARDGKGSQPLSGSKEAKEPPPSGAGFNFRGIISSCFEAHLTVYVELEEKTLMENLEKLVQEETWEAEEGSQTNILSSSTQGNSWETVCSPTQSGYGWGMVEKRFPAIPASRMDWVWNWDRWGSFLVTLVKT